MRFIIHRMIRSNFSFMQNVDGADMKDRLIPKGIFSRRNPMKKKIIENGIEILKKGEAGK